MGAENAKRDDNFVPVNTAVTNDTDKDITQLRVDPITKKLLVDAGDITFGGSIPAGSNTIGKVEAIQSGTWTITTGEALATTPTIYNVSMPLANTNYSQLLPTGTKMIDIKLRGQGSLLKVAFASISGGANYILVPQNSTFHIGSVNLTGITLYLQGALPNQLAEIICWV